MLNDFNEKTSNTSKDLSERTKERDTVRCELETLQSWRAMKEENEKDVNNAYALLQSQFVTLQRNYNELFSRDQEYTKYKNTMENENKSLHIQLVECKEQWSVTAKEYQRY